MQSSQVPRVESYTVTGNTDGTLLMLMQVRDELSTFFGFCSPTICWMSCLLHCFLLQTKTPHITHATLHISDLNAEVGISTSFDMAVDSSCAGGLSCTIPRFFGAKRAKLCLLGSDGSLMWLLLPRVPVTVTGGVVDSILLFDHNTGEHVAICCVSIKPGCQSSCHISHSYGFTP
jgi:hypothetical protein